jgi:hypothetical protein
MPRFSFCYCTTEAPQFTNSPPATRERLGLFIYFKTNLYRDVLRESPWTMYLYEYRKDQCSANGRQ